MTGTVQDRCILFADIAGSSRLYEKMGDAEAKHAIERCLRRVHLAVNAFGGRVIKTIGDAILAEFSSVEACVPAACQIQQRVAELPPVGGQPMAVRVGFHRGPVIEDKGDVFGDAVNLAARMADIAHGGQIIATGSSIEGLPLLVRQSIREIDRVTVKGRAAPVTVCEVLWQEDGNQTLVSTHPRRQFAAESGVELLLRHGEQSVRLKAPWEAFSLGRDKHCDLVVADKLASRIHARIESRGDHVVLIDQSTNGTWLTVMGAPERQLRREELVLESHGKISFGHPWQDDGEGVVFDIACG